MREDQAKNICLDVAAELLSTEKKLLPLHLQEAILDLASVAASENLTGLEVETRFRQVINEWLQEQRDLRSLWRNAQQLHHDYYVRKKLAGELDPQDEENYQLAIARERAGKVKSLEEEK